MGTARCLWEGAQEKYQLLKGRDSSLQALFSITVPKLKKGLGINLQLACLGSVDLDILINNPSRGGCGARPEWRPSSRPRRPFQPCAHKDYMADAGVPGLAGQVWKHF